MPTTEFRHQLHKILGTLADSGGKAVITHRNRTFFLVPEDEPALTERLVPHDTLLVDPDELFHAEPPVWEWGEDRNLGPLA